MSYCRNSVRELINICCKNLKEFLPARCWVSQNQKTQNEGEEKQHKKHLPHQQTNTHPPQTVLPTSSNDDTLLDSISQKGNPVQPVKALRTFSLLFLLFILQPYKAWRQCRTVLHAVKYMQYNIIPVLKSLHYPCKHDRTSYCEKGKDTVQMTARWRR